MNAAAALRLALKLLARDWRAGELTLIAVAIVIAVAGVTTVGFFTDRVQRVLDVEANRLLGADLVVTDTRPSPPELRQEAQRRGLTVIEVLRFPSMAVNRDHTALSDVKVVQAGYPLRGELRVADKLFGPDRVSRGIPEPGTVWVDERLYTSLEAKAGDGVGLGNARFPISGVITHEPGVEMGFLSGAPRVILNSADLAATGLVQPGSRVRYQLQIAGDSAVVDAYRDWARPRLPPGSRLEGIRDARPELRSALDRAEKYLNLSALTSVLLAAAAIALATRRYLQRHLDACAVLRCLGASQRLIVGLYAAIFAVLGTISAAAGVAIGGAAQAVLAGWLGNVVSVELPPASAMPAVHGAAMGLLLLLGFALPPLLGLARVPTLRVLRRDIGPPTGLGFIGYALGAATVAGMILWRAQEPRLGLTVLAWSVVGVAVACALTWLLLRALKGLRGRGGAWRFGVASLQRRQLGTIVQVVALGLGIMALLTLTLVRTDLLRTWRASLPPDAPNRFIINIQPDQVEGIRRFLAGHGIAAPELYPMVRGRLVKIGDRSVSADDYPNERAKRLITREFNLSWTTRMRPDNRVVDGKWWGEAPSRADQFSVERGLADTLGIRVGDVLTYDIAGTPVVATVTSLRSVDWDTFNVNFFVVAPPGLLEPHPTTYVTSFHLSGNQAETLNALVKAFPNIVLIDIARALAQIQAMMDQAALAIQFVFLFTLLAGLIVLYAAVASTQDERLFQATILRALGASRVQIRRAHLMEFALIGAIAGCVASAGATGLAYFVAHRFLHLDYVPDPAVWLIGIVAGALGVAAAGHLGTRRVLEAPPLQVLRAIG
ncbi:MAG TPA: FtsX-like permease family protein [Burkholderiales bacterium]|nr:FtsX-like permease family protein [Burkholderiales bacterium]